MIKVGIIGADMPDAGELLRLLIHHPEADIVSLVAPAWNGRPVSSRHNGFIGESPMFFTDKFDLTALDVVFIANDSEAGVSVLEASGDYPQLRVIDMSPGRIERREKYGLEYGLSEVNRKPLVRGARLASTTLAPVSLALIALYPLAVNNLLEGDIDVRISCSESIAATIQENTAASEIESFLVKATDLFRGKVRVSKAVCDSGRAMKVDCLTTSPLAISEVEDVFEGIYDDHNFTFTSLSDSDRSEVEGTQKCVVAIKKPGAGLLELSAVADGHMRGGAGDALHVMNLFFALDEKVGLHLKPSCFGHSGSSDRPVGWFA